MKAGNSSDNQEPFLIPTVPHIPGKYKISNNRSRVHSRESGDPATADAPRSGAERPAHPWRHSPAWHETGRPS